MTVVTEDDMDASLSTWSQGTRRAGAKIPAEKVPYVLLHFSNSVWETYINTTTVEPVSYRYFENEYNMIKKRLRQRSQIISKMYLP